MIPRALHPLDEADLLAAEAIATAQAEGGLILGRTVGHPLVEEDAELVALEGEEATLRWPSGRTARVPAAEVFDAERAEEIGLALARSRAAAHEVPPPAPPVHRSHTVKLNAAPLQRRLWGLEPLRRPAGGRD